MPFIDIKIYFNRYHLYHAVTVPDECYRVRTKYVHILFIYKRPDAERFSELPVTNLYLSIVRDAIESIRLDLYHARLIDFDDFKLLVTRKPILLWPCRYRLRKRI